MNDRTVSRAIFAIALAAALTGCGADDPAKFLASAETYMSKGDHQAAIIELKNALGKAPDNARARFLLGQALLAAGDPVSAATEFRKALALKYSPDEAYPLLARALIDQGAPRRELVELANAPVQSAHARAEVAAMQAVAHLRVDERKEARERIDAALALEPANVSARVAQAQLTAIEGNLPGALELVDAVLASAPNDGNALMLKGELESSLGKRGDAVKTFERAVAAQPKLTRARFALISSYIQSKDLDKAAAQVEEVRKSAPGDPRTLHAIAFLAFARGDDAAALAAVQKTLEAAPQFLPARYLSGLLDLRRGAYASAEDSLRTVVAQAPNEDPARIALAETYLRRGVPAKAQETLEPVLRRVPVNAAVLRLAGEIQLALKRHDLSAQYLERANALDKGDIGGRVRLAEVRLAKGDDKGVHDLEELALSDPNRREPDLALIRAHLRSRDYAKALAAADALIKKQPSSAVAYNAKGTVLLAKGDRRNARVAYEKAISLDPNLVSAAYSLARLDGMERNYAGAKKRYEEILAKDPKAEIAMLGLAELLIVANAPPSEVTAAIQRAIDAKPNMVAARVAFIQYHASRKDWKAALAAAQAANAAVPESPPILDALAAVQQASGEHNQAIETNNRLAKLQPDNPLPLVRVAGIHAGLKNYKDAIPPLKTAMVVAPENPSIWVALAGAYLQANQADAGFAEARRLQKEKPGKAAGYALEGELLGAQSKPAEAAAAYRTVMARAPLPFGAIRLHTFLHAAGKADEAASVTQKWLKDHPSDVQVRAYLGQLNLVKGDYKAAIPLFRAAVEHEPNSVILLNNLAWAMSEVNDANAVEYAERAYQLAPNLPEVVDTYGWILVQRGDTAKGIELLRRAVELAPSDAGKRLRLAKALIKSGDKPGGRKELETVAKADSGAAAAVRTQAEQLLKDL